MEVFFFVLNNVVWMLFFIFLLPDNPKKGITVKKIRIPKIKLFKTAEEKEKEEIEKELKSLEELTSVPIEDVKKGMLK